MDSKDIETSAEKIIKLFKEKEVDLPKQSVIDDLTKLVGGELELPMNDAVRVIVGKYARQHNIKIQFGGSGNGEIVPIKDLQPNTWVTVEGEVVEVSKPDNKRIHQTAIITDGTGSIKVTVWNRKPEEPHVQDLIPGKWYKIANAVVNTYNDLNSVSVQKSTTIVDIDKKEKLSPTFTKIIDVKPGIVNLHGKITKLFDAKSEKVHQSGIIGDETGSINFVIWASSKPTKKLEEGKIYKSLFAACNKFNDKVSIALCLDETTESKGKMEVKSSNIAMIGSIVAVNEGSGIIKRCPIEGCGRTLNRQNYCITHEIQKDFKYDLRIKGIIDDGIEAKYIHISAKLTAQIAEITLEDAIKKAENTPLGADGILLEIRDKLVGRYYHIEGMDMDGRIIVSNIRLLTLDEMKSITKLDFKESPQTKISDGV
jgi:replication factor A1